jgi:hypothetical protein
MSLFDVLRYPVSIPPTLEQLDRIPDELWLTFSKSRSVSLNKALKRMLWNTLPLSNKEIKEINKLKKCIADWDTNDNI